MAKSPGFSNRFFIGRIFVLPRKRGNYSEKQTFQNILLSYCQGHWLLHFRSANGKQDNYQVRKKS